MRFQKLLTAAAAATFLIAACKKGDDGGQTTNPPASSRKDTLTSGKWYITSATGTFTNPLTLKDTTVNLYNDFFDTCAQDDRFIFRTDGKLTNDQGVKKCDATGPQQSDGGTWSLTSGKDTLVMSDGTLPGRFKIVSFSNSSMQLKSDTTYILPIKLLATFVHE